MSGPNPVGISSQDAKVAFTDDTSLPDAAEDINRALGLVRDDLQRLAGQNQPGKPYYAGSGNFRWMSPVSGQVRVWAVSDTATAGSTGAAYHTLTLYRNGAAANTQTYDTRRAEVPKYLGGAYLGEATASVGDVLYLNLAVTGAPAPTLTTANFTLLCQVRET
jgi:hypothetical protein